MNFEEHIGKLVSAWRRGFDMSQEDLAEAIGVSQATISKFETGRQAPSVKQLFEILAATGKSPDEAAHEISQLIPSNALPLWERFDD